MGGFLIGAVDPSLEKLTKPLVYCTSFLVVDTSKWIL